MHLSNLRDAQWCIEQRRFSRHEDEVRRRQEYEQEYGNLDSTLEMINIGNTVVNADHNPEGPPTFMRTLRTLRWPRGFKITRVEPYEGSMNLTQ